MKDGEFCDVNSTIL